MPTPLPLSKTVPVCILLFCEAFNGNSLFAYIGNMVEDLQKTETREEVGYYAGLIASCWFLAQFLSSFFWGRLSDLVGRRPVLIAGVFGSFLSSIAFGFSFNLPFAIFSRSMNGILNGNIGVVKTYIAEFTDSSNQARAFGLIGLMWGCGSITGSMVGGFAYQPSKKLPQIFSTTGLFAQFPFLLPNLIAALLSFVGLVLTVIYLKENEIKYSTLEDDDIELQQSEDLQVSNEMTDESQKETKKGSKQSLLTEEERAELNGFDRSVDMKPQIEGGNFFSRWLAHLKEARRLRMKKRGGKGIAVLKEKQVLMTVFMYSVLGMYCTIWDEIVPLWVFADSSAGGLHFQTNDIGIANAIGGGSVIFMQAFIYHRVVQKLKCVRTFQLGSVVILPILLAFPSITYLQTYGRGAVWAAIGISFFIRCFATQCMFSSIMQLITNSAHYADMGAVNGLGQSMVALFRAFAPAFGASMLAWSFENGLSFPLNFFFTYWVTFLMALIPLFMSFYLPKTLNLPMNEVHAAAKGGDVQVEFM
eukprot:TRINITY_DN1216_c0_g1_i1.p1 TRINITY_DN1216_c0_g1~~TRINITY_DN1216_c0_g1_i1.p1  ORF type:complete len:531 (+),score=102.18 TRINITY_DN1216_c0_g1_i1:165-1757(+)